MMIGTFWKPILKTHVSPPHHNPGIACLLISCSFYRRFQSHNVGKELFYLRSYPSASWILRLPLHHILRELFSAAVNLSFSLTCWRLSSSWCLYFPEVGTSNSYPDQALTVYPRVSIAPGQQISFSGHGHQRVFIFGLQLVFMLVSRSLVLILGLEMKREDSCIQSQLQSRFPNQRFFSHQFSYRYLFLNSW